MHDLCRTCLRVPRNSIYLYDECSLMHKITVISSVEITVNKDYPSMICEECVEHVNKFFNFRKVIVNTDKDIRERLAILKSGKYAKTPKKKKKWKKLPQESKDNNILDCDNENSGDDYKPGEANCDYTNNLVIDIKTDQYSNTTKLENEPTTESMLLERRAIATYKLWKCKECNENFTSRIKFKNHRRTSHIPRTVCNICGQVLRTDNLSKHIKLHSEAPTKCDICNKYFKNSESLRSHALIHRNTRYTCEICGRTFKVKAEHSRHLRYHTDPDLRKTTCSVCGKKVHDFKRHMLTHTGERPYLCTFCGKGFTSGHALKVHLRQHTNEKPYLCPHCPSAFPQNVSLKTHLKSKHGIV